MLPCRFNISLDQRHKTIEHNKRKAVNLLQLAEKMLSRVYYYRQCNKIR